MSSPCTSASASRLPQKCRPSSKFSSTTISRLLARVGLVPFIRDKKDLEDFLRFKKWFSGICSEKLNSFLARIGLSSKISSKSSSTFITDIFTAFFHYSGPTFRIGKRGASEGLLSKWHHRSFARHHLPARTPFWCKSLSAWIWQWIDANLLFPHKIVFKSNSHRYSIIFFY